MSIRVHPRFPNEYTITPTTRSLRLNWIIHSTEPLRPQEVENASGVPQNGDECPYVPSLFAQAVTIRPERDAYHWIAEVQYGPRELGQRSQEKLPWQNPPEIRNSTEFEQVTQDYEYYDPEERQESDPANGYRGIPNTRPLLSVTHELYNPAPTRRVAIEVKQIRWWTRTWKDEWIGQYRDSLNANDVYLDGIAYSGLVLWCTQLNYNRYYYGESGKYCYQIDAEIRYRAGGWNFKPIQASFNAINPQTGKLEAVYERDGVLYYESDTSPGGGYTRISEPALLNETGNLLTKNKTTIPSKLDQVVYGRHRLLPSMDWRGLNIPTLKAVRV